MRSRLALIFGCVLLVSCGSTAEKSTARVYEGARLIHGDGSVLEDSVILVEDGKITKVGKRGEVDVPSGATGVSLTGKTVMPAIVDDHAHLGWLIVKTGKIGADTYSKENLIDHLTRVAYFGVAATQNLGIDVGDIPFEIRANPVPGAALLRTAGRGMAFPNAGPGREYWRPVVYAVATPEEARKAVQELAAKKVDIVKMWVDDRDHTVKKLTPEMYTAIIDEAHKNNLRAIAHIFYLEDAKGLLKAGIDGFAHGVRDKGVDEEFMALMKQHPNVFVIPNLPDNPDAPAPAEWLRETIPADQVQAMEDAAKKVTPKAEKTARDFFGVQARNLSKLNASGVKIGFGTDSSNTIGWSVHTEMADMVTAGMTPAQVVRAATQTAAEILKIDELGDVAAGKSASFIVLDASPMDDIRNTRKISRVILRGVELDRAKLRAEFATK